MPTVLVKEFFRNFSGIFPEKFRASYFSGKVTTLAVTLPTHYIMNFISPRGSLLPALKKKKYTMHKADISVFVITFGFSDS